MKPDLIPSAEAQTSTSGFGFAALGGVIQTLWSISRNITYFLLVIAIIVASFMIMFRVKISPQTVITVETAIPKIILTLIFITFSYAIAGFLIDLIYVVIGVLSAILTQGEQPIFSWCPQSRPIPCGPQPPSIFGDVFSLLTQGPLGTGMVGWIFPLSTGFGMAVYSTLSNFFGIFSIIPSVRDIISIISGITFFVVILVLIFFVFKIFWSLFLTYARIILLVIAGPFYILFGIFVPRMGIGQWIKELISNLAVYPLMGVLIIISYIFLISSSSDVYDALNTYWAFLANVFFNNALFKGQVFPQWAPPLTTGGGEVGVQLLLTMASFAVLAIIPKAADAIRAEISGKGFAYGTAIGAAIGLTGGVAGGLWRGATFPARYTWGIYSKAMEDSLRTLASQSVPNSWMMRLISRLSGRS